MREKLIIILLSVLASCSPSIPLHTPKEIGLDTLNHTFLLEINDHTGSPVDVVYHYDHTLEKEYVFQMFLKSDTNSFLTKGEFLENGGFKQIDSVKLSMINTSHNFRYLTNYVLSIDTFVLVLTTSHGENSIYKFKHNRIDQITKLEAVYIQDLMYISEYVPYVNQIFSDQYISKVLPAYSITENFGDLKQSYGVIAQDSNHYLGVWLKCNACSSMSKEAFFFLYRDFSIHERNRVVHLYPTSNQIEMYNPVVKRKTYKALDCVDFSKNKYNVSSKIMEVENTYWQGFIYNPFRKEYYLILHEPYPYFGEDGISPYMHKPDDIRARIFVLDTNFDLKFEKVILEKQYDLSLVKSVKKPYPNGYVCSIYEKDKSSKNKLKVQLVKINLYE